MRFVLATKPISGHPDAAAWLCVLFPLAFFLLLGSQLVLPPGVAVELPAGGADIRLAPDQPRIVLAVDRQGRTFLDNQFVPESDLVRRLAERRSRLPGRPVVLLHADAAVAHEVVVRLGGIARKAGLEQVFLMARQAP
ncbi:MAG: biopolymer transporter ExbD [Verrucomicrobiota bacterium]|jgi:biopolymer transport protein ExbD